MTEDATGFDELAVHAYQIGERPYPRLCIGVPQGQKRPALWVTLAPHHHIVLASFHGDQHAAAAVQFVDTLIDQINVAITHYQTLHEKGDETRDAQG